MFNVSNEFQAVLVCNLVENAKKYQYFSIFCNFLHIFFRTEPPGQRISILFSQNETFIYFLQLWKVSSQKHKYSIHYTISNVKCIFKLPKKPL